MGLHGLADAAVTARYFHLHYRCSCCISGSQLTITFSRTWSPIVADMQEFPGNPNPAVIEQRCSNARRRCGSVPCLVAKSSFPFHSVDSADCKQLGRRVKPAEPSRSGITRFLDDSLDRESAGISPRLPIPLADALPQLHEPSRKLFTYGDAVCFRKGACCWTGSQAPDLPTIDGRLHQTMGYARVRCPRKLGEMTPRQLSRVTSARSHSFLSSDLRSRALGANRAVSHSNR